MTPSNDFLKSINLSTELYELLLEKLHNSLDQLQDILDTRNRAVIDNKWRLEQGKLPLSFSKSTNYHNEIKELIAEVRLYKKLVDVNATVIRWLELYT